MNNKFKNTILLSVLLSVILVTSVLVVSLPTAEAATRTVIRTINPVAVSTAFGGYTAVNNGVTCTVSIPSNPSCNEEKIAAVTDGNISPPDTNAAYDLQYVKSTFNNDRLVFIPQSIQDAESVNYIKIIAFERKADTSTTKATKSSLTVTKGTLFNSLPRGGSVLNLVYDSNLSTPILDAYTRTLATNPFGGGQFTAQNVKDWTHGIGGPELGLGFEHNTDAKQGRVSKIAFEISMQVTPSLFIDSVSGVSSTTPRWGLDSITVSGHTTGEQTTAPADKLIFNWGDGSAEQTVTLTGSTYTSPSHIYATAGDKTITVKFTDNAGNIFDTETTIVTVKKHATSLTIGSHGEQPWGGFFTISGILKDTEPEVNAGISGESITFSGTGVGTLQTVLTGALGAYSSSGNAPQTIGSWTLFADHAESAQYLASNQASDPYDTREHYTTLTLTLKPSGVIYAGDDFTAFGKLTDDDAGGIGLIGQTITIANGLTNPGAVNVPQFPTTSVTEIQDASSMIIQDCINCDVGLNKMTVHVGTIFTLPENSPAARLTMLKDDALDPELTAQVKLRVTPGGTGDPFEQTVTVSNEDLTVFTASDGTGVLRIEIIEIVGSTTVDILRLQTLSSDDVVLADIDFTTLDPQTVTTLTFAGGGYFADLESTPAPTPEELLNGFDLNLLNDLEITASFNGGTLYESQDASQTYDQQLDLGGYGGEVSIAADSGVGTAVMLCLKDDDKDAICNNWELTTGSSPGIPYNVGSSTPRVLLTGASKTVDDIFLELDAMTFHTPRATAIADLVAAFALKGVTLHVETDETNLAHVDPLHMWTDFDTDRTNDFDCLKADHFGPVAQRPTMVIPLTPFTSTPTSVIFSGLTISTPTDPAISDKTQGTIIANAKVTFASGTPTVGTITLGADSASILGISTSGSTPITASLSPTAVATEQTLKIKIPFSTSGLAIGAAVGTITVNFVSSPSISLAIADGCTPTISTTRLDARAQVYHYGIFAHTLAGRSSGQAEARGNDLVISLGEGWGEAGDDPTHAGTIGSTKQQAGTLMHELGHNLNLGHGGPFYLQSDALETPIAEANVNCKPNLPSVMTYARQTPDYLGQIDWRLDYSSGIFGPLNENSLNEAAGLVSNTAVVPVIVWGIGGGSFLTGPSTANGALVINPVNWNGIAPVDQASVTADINNFAIYGCQATPGETALTDFNEWGNLEFNFRKGLSGSIDGHHENTVSEQNDDSQCQIKWASDFTTNSVPPFFIHFDGERKVGTAVPFKFQVFDIDGVPFGCGLVTLELFDSAGGKISDLDIDYEPTTSNGGQYHSNLTAPELGTYYLKVTVNPPGDLTDSFTLFDPDHSFSVGGKQMTARLTTTP